MSLELRDPGTVLGIYLQQSRAMCPGLAGTDREERRRGGGAGGVREVSTELPHAEHIYHQ